VFRFKEKIDIRRMIDIKEILSLESLSVQFFLKKQMTIVLLRRALVTFQHLTLEICLLYMH
jgi:hypothetical protein